MKVRDLITRRAQHEGTSTLMVGLPSQPDSVQATSTPVQTCSCGHTEGVWIINRGKCWVRWVCEICLLKVAMPAVHYCDASLPLTAPCSGQMPRRLWVCSWCEAGVEVESVEKLSDRTLTYYRCPQGCSAGVTSSASATPLLMVPKVEQ
jgi:hypothetical protein